MILIGFLQDHPNLLKMTFYRLEINFQNFAQSNSCIYLQPYYCTLTLISTLSLHNNISFDFTVDKEKKHIYHPDIWCRIIPGLGSLYKKPELLDQ